MTIEEDEGRIARIRTRAYYLSQARGPTTSDEQNWIDAEAAERADEASAPVVAPAPEPVEPAPVVSAPIVVPDARALFLARVPLALAAASGAPHGRFAALVEEALAGGSEQPLLQLEEALTTLARRKKPAEHAPATRGLADPSDDPLVAALRWDLACAELAVLAALDSAGRLAAIGAPAGFACTLGAKQVAIAVQARPALGSGFAPLRARLLSEAGDAPADRALVLRTVGAPKSSPPGALERLAEVARAPTASFAIGELTFDWFSTESAEGSPALVSALLPGFRREVEQAAKAACADTERELPFLLAEVVLPASPEDVALCADPLAVRETVARKAAAGAAHLGYSAGSLWLGLLRIDWRSPEPTRTLFIRPAATWPLSYRELGAELGARVVVL